MKAAGITTWFQFTQDQCLFCHQGQKRMAFWPLFCRWFGYYFTLVWKIHTTSLACEYSCILCQNFENFWPKNGQFFSVGDATASSASLCRTLMLDGTRDNKQVWSWHPMFEPEPFGKQMYCTEETTCDIVGPFQRLTQWFRAHVVIRRLRNCSPLFPP